MSSIMTTSHLRRILGRHWLGLAALVTLSLLGSGCAAVSNPVGQGIPVNRLPPEYFAPPKEDLKPIPLTAFKTKKPDEHLVDKGDVLGVYIEGILGEKGTMPPVRLPDQNYQMPSVGYPVVVTEDGKLPLTHIPPIDVKGMTISQVRDTIIDQYVKRKLVQPGKEKGTAAVQVLVSLLRPRHVRVQVIREDSAITNTTIFGNARRGTGTVVDLPIYENDVSNALSRTGGTPGLDAINQVIVQRGDPFGNDDKNPSQVVRLPLRIREGEPIPFRAEDVVLKDGDIIYIQARDTEVYYTGGLILARQFILPRDLDVRVSEAIANAGGPLVNGGVQQNNLSGNIIASGLGSPSPSHVTVLRRTRDNGQISIIVDLNKALNDRRENIIIQAGDVVILQETVGESMTRYFSGIYRFNMLDVFLNSSRWTATQAIQGAP
jgi:protein involved in polysaccharide export with SLBB domain